MKLKKIELKKFKRFTDTTVTSLPETVKLIVLIGPNGSGKTSLIEAFKQWTNAYGGFGLNSDLAYMAKDDKTFFDNWSNNIKIEFHGDKKLSENSDYRKVFYIRSAYRNEADFTLSNLEKVGLAIDSPHISRLIDNDASVSNNYKRIVSNSVEMLFSGKFDTKNVKEVRETLIGEIRESMKRVFGDLLLKGTGDPLKNGAFFFEKGISKDFHFKNLSGGEKAAFDLILDLIIKKVEYTDSIFCIDEPDLHLHTKLQSKLLGELYNLIPENSQLVISTHSIGMIKKAVELQKQFKEKVVFLDFHGKDPDEKLTVTPIEVDRNLWKKTLEVALDDLAHLVSPKQIVICEGNPTNLKGKNKEFDASVLRKIFDTDFSDTDFISIGNEKDVTANKIDIITALKTLTKGVDFIKVIDRDDRSEQEIGELKKQGVKVLNYRDIESYLLDDEIIEKLCTTSEKKEKLSEAIELKKKAMASSVLRGNPTNDLKSASGEIYVGLKKLLSLTNCGNSTETFLRDTIAPLITHDTRVYSQLKKEIFE